MTTAIQKAARALSESIHGAPNASTSVELQVFAEAILAEAARRGLELEWPSADAEGTAILRTLRDQPEGLVLEQLAVTRAAATALGELVRARVVRFDDATKRYSLAARRAG